MKKRYYLLILLALSAGTHFIWYGRPAQVVFDEVYFSQYGADYLSGSYYFDPHPPLGKMLIGATAHIAGGGIDTTDYSAIGDPYKDSNYLWYRLLPTVAGTLLPLVAFLLALELGMSAPAAFVAGMLLILENSLLVQSRMASLDSMLLLSGCISFWAYFRYRRTRTLGRRSARYWLVIAAIFAALTFSFKWTGLTFLGMIGLVECVDLVRIWLRHRKTQSALVWPAFKGFIARIATFLGIGFAIYFSVFAVHFALLTKSGQGDAFMSASFQKTLAGSQYQNDPDLSTPSLWGKFTEINHEMYAVNASMTATHPYSSTWYTWPLMLRPVFYWQDSVAQEYIYYLGNPFIYWFGTLSVWVLLVCVVVTAARKRSLFHNPMRWNIGAFIGVAYIANWLPFMLIKRPMFLYHYEAALVVSIIAIGWLVDGIRSRKWKLGVVIALLVICAAAFLYWSPLSYGLPLDSSQLQARMWLPGWR